MDNNRVKQYCKNALDIYSKGGFEDELQSVVLAYDTACTSYLEVLNSSFEEQISDPKADSLKDLIQKYRDYTQLKINNYSDVNFGTAFLRIGALYSQLSKLDNEQQNLSSSVDSFEQALNLFDSKKNKETYANVLKNLSDTYLNLAEQTKEEQCITKSINYSKEYQSLYPGSYAESTYNKITQNLKNATTLLDEILKGGKQQDVSAISEEKDWKLRG